MIGGLDPQTLQMLLQSAPPPPMGGGMGMPPQMGGMPGMGMGMQPPPPQMDPMSMMALLGGGGMPPQNMMGAPSMGMPGMGMDPSMMGMPGMGGPPPVPPMFGPQGAAPPPDPNIPIQPEPQPNELGAGEALDLPPNSSLEETTKNIDSPDMSVEKMRGVNVSLQKLAGSVDPETGDLLTQAAKLINNAIAKKSGVNSVSVLSSAQGDGISPIDELQNESPFRMNAAEEKPEESILNGSASPRNNQEQKKAAPKTNTVKSTKL